jgi:hypothetical protein
MEAGGCTEAAAAVVAFSTALLVLKAACAFKIACAALAADRAAAPCAVDKPAEKAADEDVETAGRESDRKSVFLTAYTAAVLTSKAARIVVKIKLARRLGPSV